MVRGRLVSAYYLLEDKIPVCYFIIRGENGEKFIERVPRPFKPYCFIRKKDLSEIQNFEVESEEFQDFIKLKFETPDELKRFRDRLRKKVRFFEADIPYIERVLIDFQIYQYIEIEGTSIRAWDPDREIPFRIAYLDLETEQASEIGTGRLISAAVIDEEGEEFFFDLRRTSLLEFLKFLFQFDILVGWNILDFDREVLIREARFEGLNFEPRFWSWLDLGKIFKRTFNLRSWSLDYISREFLNEGKVRVNRRIEELSIEELREYNLQDARLLRKLEDKFGFTKQKIELSKLTGCFIEDSLFPSKVVDSFILREAFRLNPRLIFPSRERQEENSRFTGALILEPKAGLWENVVVFDLTSLYNRIVQIFNISPETKTKNGKIKGLKNSYLSHHEKLGIFPQVLMKFENLRNYYKRLKLEEKDPEKRRSYEILEGSVKGFLLSFYGALGDKRSRYYDRTLAEEVTSIGRELLKLLISIYSDQVIYADTDGLFLRFEKMPSDEELENLRKRFLEILQLFQAERGIEEEFRRLDLKVDYKFKRLLISEKKKRYAGLTVDGEFLVRGFETVRTDCPLLASRVQSQVLRMVLRGEDLKKIRNFLLSLREFLFRGDFDDELIISQSLSRDPENYKANQPHIRVARELRDRGIEITDKIRYYIKSNPPLLLKPYFEGEAIEIERSGYEYYWNKKILPPVERILRILNVDWIEDMRIKTSRESKKENRQRRIESPQRTLEDFFNE